MSLTVDEEGLAALAEVERFARRAVGPLCARHERPMSAGELAGALRQAEELGLLADAASGLGPFEDPSPAGFALGARAIAALARTNAGFAHAVASAAIARRVATRLGLSPTGLGCALVQGRFGLARRSLARLLAGAEKTGRALEGEDRATLADVYARSAPRVVSFGGAPRWWLAAAWDDAGLAWELWRAEDVNLEPRPHAHGLDELVTATVAPREGVAPEARAADPSEARDAMAEALALSSAAALATALGAAERALGLARGYASSRRQGGAPIEDHPAVLRLLASARAAIASADAALAAITSRPAGAALGRALALRGEAHVALARATNDCVQIFGGLGYMRDTGVEKAMRDANHLRALFGSPSELAIFVGEWERLDGP